MLPNSLDGFDVCAYNLSPQSKYSLKISTVGFTCTVDRADRVLGTDRSVEISRVENIMSKNKYLVLHNLTISPSIRLNITRHTLQDHGSMGSYGGRTEDGCF